MILLILPVLTGLLLIGSFPRANQGYLAWVAFTPLIVSVFRTVSIGRAFWAGFMAGAIEFLALLIWIPAVLARYGGVPTPLAWILYGLMVAMLASFPGVACAFSRFLMKRGGDKFLLLFPFAWVTLEYIRDYIPFGGFPWLLAGYSQTRFLTLIQIADLAGVYGVSFLILWLNVAFAWFWLRGVRRSATYWPLISGAAVVAGCLLYGQASLRHWEKIKPDFNAAMLQGNISFDDPEPVQAEKLQQGYLQMADRLKPSSVDLLILPESPSPLTFQYDSSYRQAMEHLAQRFSLGMVLNNISYEEVGGVTRYFNSAYFLDGHGTMLGRYDKIHLVPFGEYIPWKKFFFFAETISKDVGDFYPGHDYLTVNLGSQPVNAMICFEAVFPDLVRRFVRQGSQLLVSLTNDGWYGDSAAPYQHLAIARWRAIENRRYMLRATNSGISAVVEPTGRIQTSTGLLQEAVCVGRFAFLGYQTVYTHTGDLFVILCAIITCFWVIYFGLSPKRK